MVQTTAVLPDGYQEIERINLQKDKKTAILVNASAFVIAAAMIAIGILCHFLNEFFDGKLMKAVLFAVGVIAYLLLHELVHGIVMKRFSGVKPKYGFTGLYAYAGSEAYFNKRHYCIIALAPVVIWGVVLLVLMFLVPASWLCVVYLIQMINISGAAGDFYIILKIHSWSDEVLIQDSGVEMTVYSSSTR